MKTETLLLIIFVTMSFGQKKDVWTLKSYGEISYSNFNYSADPAKSEWGSIPENRATVDLTRLVLKSQYHYDSTFSFSSEIEFEHGGTGGAMEIEYEEFGEYEKEVEKGGEIVLEELYLTKKIGDYLSLRAGHFIVRAGPLNIGHKPQQYLTTIRPESETSILPEAWDETGIEIFGTLDWGWVYQMQLVNGLDASGFSSQGWVKTGHQGKFEMISATDLAGNIKIEYAGMLGLRIGFTTYLGNADNNRPKGDMTDEGDGMSFLTSPDVSVFSGYIDWSSDSYVARGMFIYGVLKNSKEISIRNRKLSTLSGQARNNVASNALAWSIETGMDVLQFSNFEGYKLLPFVRYEYVNSMERTDSDILADNRYAKTILTVGFNFLIHRKVMIKSDYSMRRLGLSNTPWGSISNFNNSIYNAENTYRIVLAFQSF